MQIKTTMKYHLSPVRMAMFNKSTNVRRNLWRKGNPSALLVRMQTGTATVNNVWNPLRKWKMELPLTQQYHCWDYTLRTWNTNSEEPMHPNFHSSTIYNGQVLEATLVAISKGVDQKTGTFTWWNTMHKKERRSSCPLRQHGWNWKALC